MSILKIKSGVSEVWNAIDKSNAKFVVAGVDKKRVVEDDEQDQKQKRRSPTESRDMSNTFKVLPQIKEDYHEGNKEIRGYLDMNGIMTNASMEHGGVKLEDYIGELSQWKAKGNDSLKEWNDKSNLVLEEDIECLSIAKRYKMSNDEVRGIESCVDICCTGKYKSGQAWRVFESLFKMRTHSSKVLNKKLHKDVESRSSLIEINTH